MQGSSEGRFLRSFSSSSSRRASRWRSVRSRWKCRGKLLGDGIVYFTLEERLGATPELARKKEKRASSRMPLWKRRQGVLRRLRLLGTLLLDFFYLVDEVISLLHQRFALFLALHHFSLAALQRVLCSHRPSTTQLF